MNIKNIALIAVLILFMVGCATHYRTHIDVPEAKTLTQSLDRITFKAEVKYSDTWESVVKKGTSFPIGDGLQVALTHCDIGDKVLVRTPFGLVRVDVEVRNRSYWIGDTEIELVARRGDISVFRKPYESENSFSLGEDPEIGTELLVLGDSFLSGENWKTGIVSMEEAPEEAIKQKEELKNCFVHTVPANPGDSGSPVLAMNQGGDYELVGILNAGNMRAQLYNLAFNVSYLREVLDEVE